MTTAHDLRSRRPTLVTGTGIDLKPPPVFPRQPLGSPPRLFLFPPKPHKKTLKTPLTHRYEQITNNCEQSVGGVAGDV